MTPLKITLILIIKLRKITNINKRTFVDKMLDRTKEKFR